MIDVAAPVARDGALRHRGAQVATLVAMVWLSQTVLVLVPMSFALAVLVGRGRRAAVAWWPLVLLIAVLALINSQKWPDSDLGEYYNYVDYVAKTPLHDVLITGESFVSISPEIVLFKVYVWALGKVSGGSRVFFTFISTLLIYGAAAMVCRMLVQSQDTSRSREGAFTDRHKLQALAIAAALLLGITFSVTAHLTRQYLAGALFFVGTVAFLTTSRRRWLLLPALSVFVHPSTVVLAAPLALALIHRRRPLVYGLLVVGTIVVGAAGLVAGQLESLSGLGNFLLEDGTQSPALLALDAAVVGASMWLCHRCRRDAPAFSSVLATLLAFTVALAALLFVVRDIPLLFFRNYFYFEFIRTALLALLLHAALSRFGRAREMVAIGMVLVGCAFCWQRTMGSEWSYGSGGLVPLRVFDVLQRWDRIEGL